MKQTAIWLTTLVVALLAVTGFTLSTSLEQNRMLARLQQQHDALVLEALENRRQLDLVRQERDALSQKLNDAVLSSQEANSAAALQQSRNDALQQALNAAQLEVQTLRHALENAPTLPPSIN